MHAFEKQGRELNVLNPNISVLLNEGAPLQEAAHLHHVDKLNPSEEALCMISRVFCWKLVYWRTN
jgi:hypothetical protein